MENKYNELERLNQLKANGTITDTEYEIEKYKVLNLKSNKVHTNKNKSKLFFVISAVNVIPILICAFIWFQRATDTTVNLNRSQQQRFVERLLYDIGMYGTIIFAVIAVVLLVMAIIFRIKEKGGIKVVD